MYGLGIWPPLHFGRMQTDPAIEMNSGALVQLRRRLVAVMLLRMRDGQEECGRRQQDAKNASDPHSHRGVAKMNSYERAAACSTANELWAACRTGNSWRRPAQRDVTPVRS